MAAFTIFTAALACLAPLVNAYTTPTGDGPVGNPISAPGTGSTVPVGQPYTVQWSPTTSGTVTLVLMKGPANSLSVVGPIAENIDNSGSFVWTPSSDLTEGPTSTTGYGIQLIVDSNGQYQYTTQFGISNSASSSTGSSSNSTAPSSDMSAVSSTAPTDSATTSTPATTTTSDTSSTDAATSTSDTAVVTLPTDASTTLMTAPASISVTVSKPTFSQPSRTTGAVVSASQSGAASSLKSGLYGMAALAGVAVLAV